MYCISFFKSCFILFQVGFITFSDRALYCFKHCSNVRVNIVAMFGPTLQQCFAELSVQGKTSLVSSVEIISVVCTKLIGNSRRSVPFVVCRYVCRVRADRSGTSIVSPLVRDWSGRVPWQVAWCIAQEQARADATHKTHGYRRQCTTDRRHGS